MTIFEQGPAAARGLAVSAPANGFYVRPFGLIAGHAAASLCADRRALQLAGGPFAFTHAELAQRSGAGGVTRRASDICTLREEAGELHELFERLSSPRESFAGFPVCGAMARPLVMGIVNVTPDSFSDGGDHADPVRAIAHGRALVAAGADIVDIGGESTRPGARPVSLDEELRRVLPVVEALAGDGAAVSIDTRHAAVMRAAIRAGARIVNDVTALTGDLEALPVVADSDAAVILMHMAGDPQSMQDDPRYDDVLCDVYDALAARVAACEAAGIGRARLCVDPGIGFGKTVEHNLALLAGLAQFHGLGCAVAIGVSRKGFIGKLTATPDPKDRLAGSLAFALHALGQGAHLVRVHDVAETVQAVRAWRAGAMS